MTLPGEPFGEFEFGLSNVPPGPLPGCVVDLDVDEDHDAAGDVEGPEGAVHHVTAVVAQLQNKKQKLLSSFCFTSQKSHEGFVSQTSKKTCADRERKFRL